MDERLIEAITERVLEILHTKANSKFKLTAVITGGTIGLTQGFQQLRMLLAEGNEITVVLSGAAAKMIGVQRVKQELGKDMEIFTDEYPKEKLSEIKALLVPVLTFNSAAKLACSIHDTPACTVIMQSLMMGKPVIAAHNACSLNDEERIAHGMGGSTPGLVQACNEILGKLKSFGVSFVDVNQLAEQTRKTFGKSQYVKHCLEKKKVISAGEIKQFAVNGTYEIRVSDKDIITPLAFDACREYGVIIKRG